MNTIIGVSFIVITRNEEFGINKCLETISLLELEDCEIICVDSGSIDSTVQVIKGFKSRLQNLYLFQIEGYANSAIARNAGIRKASKEYIFFIDGDVEITEYFILTAIKTIKAKKADAVVGQLSECQYEQGFSKIINVISDRYSITKNKRFYSSGGIFMTKRSVVEAIGFFDESLVKSQDYDFTLRMTEKFIMLGLNILMGTHHTIPYHDLHRLINEMLFAHKYLGRVIRKNIFINPTGVFDLFFIKNRGICFGFIFYIMTGLSLIVLPDIKLLIVLITLMLIDVLMGLTKKSLLHRIWSHYFAPATVMAGLYHCPADRPKYHVNAIPL